MADPIQGKILDELRHPKYRPLKPRQLAKTLRVTSEEAYPSFRDALKQLMHEGRVVLGQHGTLVLPTERTGPKGDEIVGTYRQNKKGFGFVIPMDPTAHEDLYISENDNKAGAITGDMVKAKVISRRQQDGKAMVSGRITEVMERKNKRFVGSLQRKEGEWFVMPDGNTYTEAIYTPDAATKYIKPGTKVVVEITEFPTHDEAAMGVITDVLGQEGEKDVDLKTVIVQFNLPGDFPDEVKDQASAALAEFKKGNFGNRLDLSDEVICTIDPDDAKAVSYTHLTLPTKA